MTEGLITETAVPAASENAAISNASEFLEAAGITQKLIDLPTGKQMWVRPITSDEIKDVNKRVAKDFGGKDVPIEQSTFREHVVIKGAMRKLPDGSFKQLFQAEQHLKGLKASAVGWIATPFNEILKLSGLSKEVVAAKEQELEADPLDSDSSDSY